jgi:hypothetical protein
MATSSFDTTVKIDKHSASSLEKIINTPRHTIVDLHTQTAIKQLTSSNLAEIIGQNKKTTRR